MVVNRNGFSNTFTLYQMMPVLFIVLMSIELGLILAALDSKAVKIIVGLIQLGMLVGAGVLWVMTTKIDPSDSIQLLHHKSLEEGGSFNFSDFKYFCQLCQTCVSKNAFHCRKCNRCVEVFDHHCKWLNNCIGAKNYFEFLGLISCSEILLLLHIIVNIVDCVARGKSEHPFSWIFYVEIVFCLLDVVILGFNTSLLAMHIYLVVNKKTTL